MIVTVYVLANGESEDGALSEFGYVSSNSATNLDTMYARLGYFSSYNNNPNGYTWNFGASISHVYMKCHLSQNFGGTTINQSFMSFYDGNNERIRLELFYDSGAEGFKVRVYTVNGATVTNLVESSLALFQYTSGNGNRAGWIAVEIDYNVSGKITIYGTGRKILSWSGNPIVGGSTTLSKIRIRTSRTASSWGELRFTHLLIADEPVLTKFIALLYPNGSGTNSGWTGAYTTIDETWWNITDYATTNSINTKSTWNCSNVHSFFNNADVKSLSIYGISSRGNSGPANIVPVIRTGGIDYTGTTYSNNIIGSYDLWKYTWNTNPNTSASFTISDLNSIEIGIEARE